MAAFLPGVYTPVEGDPNRFNSLTRVLFDQAALAAGESLKDPAGYVKRLNALLLELSA